MNRPYRPTPPQPAPVPLSAVMDRVLVGAFAALVVARPLVAGDDPGRLRLTDSGGPVSFNLCLMVVLIGFAIWRVAAGRGRPASWAVVPILIAAVGVTAYVSSRLPDRYARPGLFIGWEWIGLAVAYYLTRRLTASAADSRGLLNVLLASAVSVAGLGLYQAAADRFGLPTTDIVVPPTSTPLAGDDEFYPELDRPSDPPAQPRGTFDSPETLFIFLMLVLPVAAATARASLTSRWVRLVFFVPLAAAMAIAFVVPFHELGARWSATLGLFTSHPLLGVGPGNIARELNGKPGADGAWIALAATTGLIGAGLFATALTVAVRQAWPRTLYDPDQARPAGPRWEFYYGGVFGLLLGLIWGYGAMPAEAPAMEVFRLGGAALLRAVLWFASFALAEKVRAHRTVLGRAVLIGAAPVLAYGIVSDAPGRPTVLFPLFVLLAIGANLRRPEVPELADGGWTKPVRVVGVIAACGLAVLFLVTAAVPAWETADAVHQARMASRLYPDLHREIDRARPGADRATALTKARGFLLQNILTPLRDAATRDPNNAPLVLELARWRRPLWEYQLTADPADAARVGIATREAAERAARLDPHNPAAPRNFFEALLLYRLKSNAKQPERVVALNKVIAQVAERRPEDEVPLRFRLVQTLLEHGDPDEAKPELVKLLELNREEGHGHLTAEQKAEVIDQAKAAIKSDLPKIVLEEWTR